jgi:FkbM family methyltransferase
VSTLLHRARRAFYNADGPWHRNRLAERFGSRRWSRPALHGMDERLEALVDRDGGVFLEAGAHDGYTQSNTYYLERFRGWSGVLVEAMPELHAKASRRRPRSHVANCALVAPEQAGGTIAMSFGDLMSTIGDGEAHAEGGLRNAGRAAYTVQVPARTLDQVLDEAGVEGLDLMVLDLEGHELEALRGISFDRHPVKHLVVEMLDLQTQRGEFDALLAPWFDAAGELSKDDALYSWRS